METEQSNENLCVVALGASAGGITPLKEFFAHVPRDAGIAWVVILHLSPEHDSKLAEVLQTSTLLPASQVTERTVIQPNRIYVAPPNRSLEVADDALIVRELTHPEQRRAAIDVFFRSLAETHGASAAGVLLSGSGSDGTAGLERLKERGGLTLVQQPREAEHAEMPLSAIATGLIDLVLPVAEMPQRIVEYLHHVRRGAQQTFEEAPDSTGLREVLRILHVKNGHDFSHYKLGTVQRRVDRRMQVHRFANIADYVGFLRTDPYEGTALMKELLISVTSFFRDADAWRFLEESIVPRLLSLKRPQDKLRVWSAGCATGEEAYALAMLLTEHTSVAAAGPGIQVFGTDLDANAIAVAREGFYNGPEVADVSEERLRRFFHAQPGGYRVRRELRELVLFAHHNVITDPPFLHLDLVCCRNVLIYLNKAVQQRVLETFRFSLRSGGFLFLGTSESTDAGSSDFAPVDRKAHVYECVASSGRPARDLDQRSFGDPFLEARAFRPRAISTVSPPELHQRLLEQYGGPSVIVTDDHTVLHVSERAGRYLQVAGGEPSRDLLQLVREEMRADIRTALHESGRDRRVVDVRGVPVSLEDGHHLVDISVRPAMRVGDPPRGYYLVMFHEHEADVGESPVETAKVTETDRSPAGELARVRAHLESTVEQYETQADAAQAANEDLQALNEELRSAAEELETGREELQSVNEELSTVNQELQIKIEELGVTNNDFQNFINSTDIGTIFLDRKFRVKLFTPHAQKVFNLVDTDIGRPLSDITSHLLGQPVHEEVRQVMDKLDTIEREVQTHDGCFHLMRLRPYRTGDNRIDGVVLTFHDITTRREAQLRSRQADERLRLLAESAVDYGIFTMTEAGTIESWNVGAERLFRYTAAEIIGQPIDILFTPEDRAARIPQRELDTARRTGRAADERYHLRKDGSRFYVSGATMRLGEGGLGFAKIARDLTRQQQADESLRHAHRDLEQRVKDRTRDLEAEKTIVTDLVRRIVNAQEDERARIARDLHDSMGQQMTALRLSLERHAERCPVGESDKGMHEALALTSTVGEQMDFLARQLRPAALEDLGLASALPRFVEAWSANVGITAEFRVGEFVPRSLSIDVETTFYRIAQEALNNVAKHAHATRVDVMLSTREGFALMIIEDDGIGFAPSDAAIRTQGMGLLTMRERAALVGASLDIESEAGRGTSLYLRAAVRIP